MRILVISDIHGNFQALQSVLDAAGDIAATWNLGDTIGYGPEPRICLETVRQLRPEVNLAGNHDLACIGALPVDMFNSVARAAAAWTADQLSEDDRAYVEGLPTMTREADLLFAHGSPRDPIWEYVDADPVIAALFDAHAFHQCYVGHTHQAAAAQFSESVGGGRLFCLEADQRLGLNQARWIINPGSVGQPRDGDPRAAFGIADTDRGDFTAYRVPYDISVTRREMIAAGLPLSLAERLAIGR